MYIAPQGQITLYSGVPFAPDYEDTVYFNSKQEQEEYLFHFQTHQFSYQSYTRISENKVRVQFAKEMVEHCNYMCVQNVLKNLYNKKYYAFIVRTEYVNNETTDITFFVDYLQTYHFDYTLGECLVEREHTASDEIGEHILPEPIGCDTYIDVEKTRWPPIYEGMPGYLVASTVDANLEPVSGTVVDGVYSGLAMLPFPTADAVNAFIYRATEENKVDAIQAICAIPSGLISDNPETITLHMRDTYMRRKNGAMPYNNRLFCYPYRMLHVTNNQGMSSDYRFEFFHTNGNTPVFQGYIQRSASPCMLLSPMSYAIRPELSGEVKKEDTMTVTFPMLAWSNDTFRAWLAQNKAALAVSGATAVGNVAIGAAQWFYGASMPVQPTTLGKRNLANEAIDQTMSQGIDRMAQGFDQAVHLATRIYDESTKPPTAHGATNGELTALLGSGRLHFDFIAKQIRPDMVDRIDDFFQMFGYTVHEVKVPNRNVRRYWTYTKTCGCNVVGNLPPVANIVICAIYDKGVRFWNKDATFRNFHAYNTPIVSGGENNG